MHFVRTKGILSPKNGMNMYRGCQHGCIYCDSRSRCYQINHDFEDVEVKENAIELLETALRRKRLRCMLSTGSMSDPYQPLEAELGNTRKALLLAEKYGFGFTLITKSNLVLRDLDVLTRINRKTKCVVQMTLTTHDEALCRKIEPNVSTTAERVDALKILRGAGIPTIVWFCPILPFINDTDENVAAILKDCADAGVKGVLSFGMGLSLREGSREYFYGRLDRLFQGVKERYIAAYGDRYNVESPRGEHLGRLFHRTCERYGMMHDNDRIFEYLNAFEEKPGEIQLRFFD